MLRMEEINTCNRTVLVPFLFLECLMGDGGDIFLLSSKGWNTGLCFIEQKQSCDGLAINLIPVSRNTL